MTYALGTSTIDITAGSEDLTTVVSALGSSAGTITSSSGVTRVKLARVVTVAAGATLNLLPKTLYDFGSLSGAIKFAGTVVIGDDDGTLNPSIRTQIIHDYEQGQNYATELGLFDHTANGARIEFYGVSVISNSTLGTIQSTNNCTWIARGCTFINANADDDFWRINSPTGDLDFANVRFYGGSLFPSQAFARFDNVSIDKPSGAAITFNWGDPIYKRHVMRGFEVRNSGAAILALMAGNTTTAPKGYQIDLRNVPSDVTGAANQVNPRAVNWTDARSVGSVVKTFDLTVNATAFGGGPLDVKYLISDSDSGNRTAGVDSDNAVDAVTSEPIRHNYDLDLSWSGAASSGVISEVIYSAAFARPKSHYTSSPSVAPVWDVRLPVSVKTWQYGYLPQQTSITSVTGAVVQDITYFVDPLISEANASTVAAYTEANTAQKAYDLMHLYVHNNFGGETATIVTRVENTLDAGALDVVFDASASQVVTVTPTGITLKASTFIGNIKTSGTITTANGAAITGSIEDSAGVRVTINLGASGNILARRTDTSAELGFQSGVASATYIVPKGTTIEYSAWRLGYGTAYGSISTAAGGKVVTPNWIAEEAVDSALDVSVFLSDITVSLAPAQYNITFDAAMTANLEQIKAVIHRLFGRETSLRALLGNSGTRSLRIKSDEITILLPVVFLHRGASLTATDRVDLRGFFNTDAATTISSSYVVNPSAASGLYVAVLPVKPALDVGQLADAVEDRLGANLTAARDHSRAANVQTQG